MVTISFTYTNHKNSKRSRTIDVDAIEYHCDPVYYKPGWFISGFDHDKLARRSFAFANIDIDDLYFRGNVAKLLSLLIPPRHSLHESNTSATPSADISTEEENTDPLSK